MERHRLDCCVVRDLLPSYIEELTEEETSLLVKEHLDACQKCKNMETNMRSSIPIRKAPRKALHFLKRVKRACLIAALLSALVTLWCMWWLYDQEFHYANTDAGRLAAVEAYIPNPPASGFSLIKGVEEGTPLRVAAHAVRGKYLYIYYAAENEDHTHGILRLVRGINGKYRPFSASINPFPYTAGVTGEEIGSHGAVRKDGEDRLYALAGDNCREIYAASITFRGSLLNSSQDHTWEKTYPITEPSFLWLMEWDALEKELGIQEGRLVSIYADDIRLLDENGQDITRQFQAETVSQGGGGKGTAELFLVYVFMAIAGTLGIVFVRYFLRRD